MRVTTVPVREDFATWIRFEDGSELGADGYTDAADWLESVGYERSQYAPGLWKRLRSYGGMGYAVILTV